MQQTFIETGVVIFSIVSFAIQLYIDKYYDVFAKTGQHDDLWIPRIFTFILFVVYVHIMFKE